MVIHDLFVDGENGINRRLTFNNVVYVIKRFLDVCKHLFFISSKAEPKLIDVSKMIFLLIGAGIIEMKHVPETVDDKSYVILVVQKVAPMDPTLKLMKDECWIQITLKTPMFDYNSNVI